MDLLQPLLNFGMISIPKEAIQKSHSWQAFVHESIRLVARRGDINSVLDGGLPIDMVTQKAFEALGENGKIRSADGHTCADCTHAYKQTAGIITGDDPAAVVGLDENRVVPALLTEDADLALQDAADARQQAARAQIQPAVADENIDVDMPMINMVVMDGIVMGHTHCAFGNCTNDLANA